MKLLKYTIFFCFILLISCNSNKNEKKKDLSNTDFIYLDGKSFKHKKQDYFAIMLNYVICFRNIKNEYFVSCIKEYEDINRFESNTKDSIELQNRGHLQLIKDMGFNSIRLVFDRVNYDNSHYYFPVDNQKLYLEKDYSIILNGLEKYLNLAADYNIKVMLLIKAPVENQELEDFTIRLLKRFQNNPTIFAYDFFNEPLYFDQTNLPSNKHQRDKEDAYEIVCKWKNMMTENAPNQLFTIGFSEPIEVFEWDPSIMPVDFVAFHTYHPLRVPNEIFWYSKYVNKPWMIGETALPANNDSITYEDQRQFMKEVYGRIVDCGGTGLGWWEFQEIPHLYFEAKYTGLLNHLGTTTTKDGKYTIQGTMKPAVQEIARFIERKNKKECDCMVNYYNMVGYSNIILKGKVINKDTEKPVDGAVIRGWNENWSVGLNTFTNKKGEFTLYSNDICVHFEISAPGLTKEKFDFKADYKPISQTGVSLTTLPNQFLEYHMISYKSFLMNNVVTDTSNSESYIFNFNKTKFKNALFLGQIKTIELSSLDL